MQYTEESPLNLKMEFNVLLKKQTKHFSLSKCIEVVKKNGHKFKEEMKISDRRDRKYRKE